MTLHLQGHGMRGWRIRVALLASLTFSFVFAMHLQQMFGVGDVLFAGLSTFFCAYTVASYLLGPRNTIPFLSYASTHIWLMLVLPVLWARTSYIPFESRVHTRSFSFAIVLVFVLLVALGAGHRSAFAVLRPMAARLQRFVPTLPRRSLGLLVVAFMLLCLSLFFRATSNLAVGTNMLGQFGFVVKILFAPSFFFSLIVYSRYHDSILGGRLLFYLAFVAMAGVALLVAQIGPLMGPIVIAFVARMLWRRRLSIRLPLLAVVVFVVINPAKNAYRQQVAGLEKSGGQTIDVWRSALEEEKGDIVPESTLSRLNELAYLADAVQSVPDRISFQYGWPWRTILLSFFPRVFWPEKPDMRRIYTTEWGVQFGYMGPDDHKTLALNLPLPVDGFWNFGVIGVIGVGFVVGLVLGLLTLINMPDNATGFCIGASLLADSHANMSFGANVGAIPQTYLLMAVMIVVLSLFARLPLPGFRPAESRAL